MTCSPKDFPELKTATIRRPIRIAQQRIREGGFPFRLGAAKGTLHKKYFLNRIFWRFRIVYGSGATVGHAPARNVARDGENDETHLDKGIRQRLTLQSRMAGLIAKVFEELKAKAPSGVRYLSLRLDETPSFISSKPKKAVPSRAAATDSGRPLGALAFNFLEDLCDQSRILLCSVRALSYTLSRCVSSFSPSRATLRAARGQPSHLNP